MIALIIKPGYDKLDFLIFKTVLISKIMIFMNKIDDTAKIAV